MPQFEAAHPVRHAAERMFDLVADVERYPEFVPLCERLTIRDRRERDGRTVLTADMAVGFKAVHETFTSRVLLDREALAIRASYIDGPFRHLDNRWRFEPTGPDASVVHFAIDYEFRSRMLAMLMGSQFDRAFRRFTAAFEARADALYGAPSPKPPEPPARPSSPATGGSEAASRSA